MDPKLLRVQTIRYAKSSLILDAARKVFSEKGYHETRLEDIAVSAGFSKALLYNYYPPPKIPPLRVLRCVARRGTYMVYFSR